MLTFSEIQTILKNGENSSVEFKDAQVRAESLSKEIAAFANTQGGVRH